VPGWSGYRERVCYQTHDITEQLSSGDNVLGAVVAEGVVLRLCRLPVPSGTYRFTSRVTH